TGEFGTGTFSLTVTHKVGTVTVAVTSPPSVQELTAIAMATPSATLTSCAAGGVTWSVSPALPSGASFSTSTGVVTWTPSRGPAGSSGPLYPTVSGSTGEFGTGPFSLTVTHKVGTVTVSVTSPASVLEQSALAMATPSATLTSCAAG